MKFLCAWCENLFKDDEIIIVSATAKHYQVHVCKDCLKHYLTEDDAISEQTAVKGE